MPEEYEPKDDDAFVEFMQNPGWKTVKKEDWWEFVEYIPTKEEIKSTAIQILEEMWLPLSETHISGKL